MLNPPARSCILTVNGGSSSLKFALFDRPTSANDRAVRRLSGSLERVGLAGAQITVIWANRTRETWPVTAKDLAAAGNVLVEWIDKQGLRQGLAVVGHRIVHGGPHYHRPEKITREMVAKLRQIAPLDVDHLPGEIDLIECFQKRLPELPQVACFDTGFHHDLPRVAQIVPIPRRYEAAGIRRYGFHGLSYTYLMEELARQAGPDEASARVVLAHLGSGASLAAVSGGRCIDTTMGFTPASGLVMGTRTGDLDPGLPWFLAQSSGMTAREFHRMVNHESGLLGVSETSPDMRDLLAREEDDIRAAEAVAIFVYQARKAIGAMAAALGGLDVLVFSGGIGENSAAVRARICGALEFLGVALDPDLNHADEPVVSRRGARTEVRVIRTDEESIIARAAAAFAEASSSAPIGSAPLA